MEQQARIEARRPVLNLSALRAVIRQRFAGSLSPSTPQGPGPAQLQSESAAEAALLIILMMVQDGDNDLNAKMQSAQAIMAAKQAMRNQMNLLDQQAAQDLTLPGTGGPRISTRGRSATPPPWTSLLNEIISTIYTGIRHTHFSVVQKLR
jgi:hypothetical protein